MIIVDEHKVKAQRLITIANSSNDVSYFDDELNQTMKASGPYDYQNTDTKLQFTIVTSCDPQS